MHVLFVCTGNVCRSSTAERLALAFAKELEFTDFSAESAGTQAVAGRPMEPTAAQVLEGLGGDPADFAAQALTEKTATAADLVVTMTESEREKVVKLVPAQEKKTFTLKEAVRLASESGATTVTALAEARPLHKADKTPEDVADPMGKDEETFLTVGSEIAELLGSLTQQLRLSA